jgi:hypothetical protein
MARLQRNWVEAIQRRRNHLLSRTTAMIIGNRKLGVILDPYVDHLTLFSGFSVGVPYAAQRMEMLSTPEATLVGRELAQLISTGSNSACMHQSI